MPRRIANRLTGAIRLERGYHKRSARTLILNEGATLIKVGVF